MKKSAWPPLVVALAWPIASAAADNPPAAGTLPSGLTVVPFAVPVAVPVAVVARPTVFYSYRGPADASAAAAYAPAGNGPHPTRAAAAVPAPAEGPTPLADENTPPLGADPWRAAAAEVLTRRCAACHRAPISAASATGTGELAGAARPALFDAAGVLAPRLPRRRIVEAVEPGAEGRPRMPPAGETPLTPDELRLLREWAEPPRDLTW